MEIFTINEAPGLRQVAVTGDLSGKQAARLKRILGDTIDHGQNLELDLQQIRSIDMTCIQVIMMAKKLSMELERPINYKVIFPRQLAKIFEESQFYKVLMGIKD